MCVCVRARLPSATCAHHVRALRLGTPDPSVAVIAHVASRFSLPHSRTVGHLSRHGLIEGLARLGYAGGTHIIADVFAHLHAPTAQTAGEGEAGEAVAVASPRPGSYGSSGSISWSGSPHRCHYRTIPSPTPLPTTPHQAPNRHPRALRSTRVLCTSHPRDLRSTRVLCAGGTSALTSSTSGCSARDTCSTIAG